MTTKGGSGQTNRQMWKTEQKVKVYVESFHMIEPKDTIVLGISGGADSVCLLKILARWKEAWGISLRAVHVHHQLRGEEADADERFVRELCENEGIPCRVFHEDVQGMAQREKIGLEEAGRIARYRCFATVCEDVGGGKIALAHHQDDLAETMLHHLVRGTGMAGLCSLKPVSGNRIRPAALSGKRRDSGVSGSGRTALAHGQQQPGRRLHQKPDSSSCVGRTENRGKSAGGKAYGTAE